MLRAGHVIALCVIALLTIGVVMVNSAGMRVTPVSLDSPTVARNTTFLSLVASKSTVYMALAVLAMGVAAILPVRRLATAAVSVSPARDRTIVIAATLGLLLVLALVYAPFIGREVNGSHRWIRLPMPAMGDALSVQPSEIAKWGLVVLIAWYAVRRGAMISTFWMGLVPGLIVIGAVAGKVLIEDLGTGVLVAASASLVLVAAGARIWHFCLFLPAGAAVIVTAVLTNPYRIARITAFLNPYADPEKTGYHMIQSMTAIARGAGFGLGLGNSVDKFGFLPEDQTDFLFAVIVAEFGLAGAAMVMFLFATLLWASFSVIRREPDRLIKLATLGVTATIGLQAIMNIVVVTGVGPTKGIALPLVSSGGTGWILTAFCLGLIVSADRTRPEPLAAAQPIMPRNPASAAA